MSLKLLQSLKTFFNLKPKREQFWGLGQNRSRLDLTAHISPTAPTQVNFPVVWCRRSEELGAVGDGRPTPTAPNHDLFCPSPNFGSIFQLKAFLTCARKGNRLISE